MKFCVPIDDYLAARCHGCDFAHAPIVAHALSSPMPLSFHFYDIAFCCYLSATLPWFNCHVVIEMKSENIAGQTGSKDTKGKVKQREIER
jgi:hypothetical protein